MSIVMSLMMSEYFTSGFNIILPTLTDAVHIPEAARTRPTAVPNLAAGVSLTFESPIAGVDASATVGVAGIEGGFDEEGVDEVTDDDLLDRKPTRLTVADDGGPRGDERRPGRGHARGGSSGP